MKFFRLVESCDETIEYGMLILDTEIPTRMVKYIMLDAWEQAHCIPEWSIDDFVECLPKEWNPRVIDVDIFYV